MSEPSEGALKFADEALANARRYEPPEEDDFRDAIALVVDAAIQAERAACAAIADENAHEECEVAEAIASAIRSRK